jgi:hypothetical protein
MVFFDSEAFKQGCCLVCSDKPVGAWHKQNLRSMAWNKTCVFVMACIVIRFSVLWQNMQKMPLLGMLNASSESEGVLTTREGVVIFTDVVVIDTKEDTAKGEGATTLSVQTLAGTGNVFFTDNGDTNSTGDIAQSYVMTLVGGDSFAHVLDTASTFDCISCVQGLNIPLHQGTMSDWLRRVVHTQTCTVTFQPFQLYAGPQQVLSLVFEKLELRSPLSSISIYDVWNEIDVVTLQGPMHGPDGFTVEVLSPARVTIVNGASWRDLSPYAEPVSAEGKEQDISLLYRLRWHTRRGVPTDYQTGVWGHKDCIDRCPLKDKPQCYQRCLELRHSSGNAPRARALNNSRGEQTNNTAQALPRAKSSKSFHASLQEQEAVSKPEQRANYGKKTPSQPGIQHVEIAISASPNSEDTCDFSQKRETLLLSMQRVEGEMLSPIDGGWIGTCRSSTLCPRDAPCEPVEYANKPFVSAPCNVAVFINGSTLVQHVW